ncbi:M48 family metallopeptidase [Dasania marina]|uniref:M48 family metallopeptidase n=1 Tax=Dasania marina TaxID=471499 RepID=UPI0003727CEF|nr:SprT family zinc-dependent metalloprotease [Dasania marina]
MAFDYAIKRQRRKTMALHVLEDASVEVRVPKWLAKREIERFVSERRDWVSQQQQKRRSVLAKKPGFQSHAMHPYLGESYPLQISAASKNSVSLQAGQFKVSATLPQDEAHIKKCLTEWYRGQSKTFFVQRLQFYFPQLPINKKFPQLKVRVMKRRWGSCSSVGVVTLNVELMKYPLACIDYVVVHELCHMLEMNHSRRFYHYLASIFPDWRQRELLLEQLAQQ